MNKVCSIFSQVLKLFSRGEFEKAVKEHSAASPQTELVKVRRSPFVRWCL
jgi:hypothetical protein